MRKKGVILQRVSTDKQELSLQKAKNREYCKRHDIEIVGEYTEFDVSGYKTKLKDRTELLKILARAEEDGDFDYLIIYNFDRIIRREDEAPFVLSHLAKYNIECIQTTTSEHIKNEDMTDKLMNYIRFWQAEYESVKTSQRVADALRTKNENNEYTGGAPAFGYQLFNTDNYTKKGRRLKDIKINESEAWIIRDIFDMYVNKGMGSPSIAEELNTNPIYKGKNRPKKRNGEEIPTRFRQGSIIRIIQNPIYIGRQRYNTVKVNRDGIETLPKEEWKLKNYQDHLRIVDDEIFYTAQDIVKQNTIIPSESKNKVTKSAVLCSGIAYCECGSKLSSSFSRYKYQRKDGTFSDYGKIYRYVCREGRELNKLHKEKYGKTYYAAKKYDNFTEKIIINFLKNIDINKFKENIKKYNNSNVVELKNAISNLEKEVNLCNKNISSFENKIDEDIDNMDIYIKGIRRNEGRLQEINEEMNKLKVRLEENQKISYDYSLMYDNFKNYYDDFVSGNLEKKKIILNQIVEKIIFKNNGVKIVFKAVIEDSLIDNENYSVSTPQYVWVMSDKRTKSIIEITANFNDYKGVI